jgi:uncharacterized membrane protein
MAIDDSLLPSAAELERLKAIDPGIVSWIMERAEQEQNSRLQWNKVQSEIMIFDVKKSHRFNFTALVFTFILFLFILSSAVFCIIKGLNVEGSVIGGTAIITAVVFFLRVAIQNRDKNLK